MTTTWPEVVAAPTPPLLVGIRTMAQGWQRLSRGGWQRVMDMPIWPVAQAWAADVVLGAGPGAQPGGERTERAARRAVIASSLARSGWLSVEEARRQALQPGTCRQPLPDWSLEELRPAAVLHAAAHVRALGEVVDVPGAGQGYLVEAAADWYAMAALWPCRPASIPAHHQPAVRLWRRVVRSGGTAAQSRAARQVVLGTPRSAGLLVVDARRQAVTPQLAGVWATWCRLLDPSADPADRSAEARVRQRAIRRVELAGQPPLLDLFGASRGALGVAA